VSRSEKISVSHVVVQHGSGRGLGEVRGRRVTCPRRFAAVAALCGTVVLCCPCRVPLARRRECRNPNPGQPINIRERRRRDRGRVPSDEAAQKASMSLMDYVIGGMDRSFKLRLYHALQALDDVGLSQQWIPG
jgi:hypothetical protein